MTTTRFKPNLHTEKAIEKFNKLRALAKRKEREFKKMTKAQKRVAIAKDVIEALEDKTIQAGHKGWWVGINTDFYGEHEADINKGFSNSTQIRDLLIENLANAPRREPCTACALGAMFVCSILRHDQLTAEDVDYQLYLGLNENSHMSKYLGKFFSRDQLFKIECAFEKGEGGAQAYDWRAIGFGQQYATPRKRMIAIMKNVIENNGEFRPLYADGK